MYIGLLRNNFVDQGPVLLSILFKFCEKCNIFFFFGESSDSIGVGVYRDEFVNSLSAHGVEMKALVEARRLVIVEKNSPRR